MKERAEKPVTDQAYYDAVNEKPAHPLYQKLLTYLEPSHTVAVELGCGVGRGAILLAEQGIKVYGYDIDPIALNYCRLNSTDPKNPEWVQADLSDVNLPATDIVVAQFVLFMLQKQQFSTLWKQITHSLNSGGIFMGQFLGVRDEWGKESLTHTLEELHQLFQEFEVLHLQEEERDGKTVKGQLKHWHIFHVILRKKASLA